jgi:uncharacterized repeat protein (TIGR03803 family)
MLDGKMIGFRYTFVVVLAALLFTACTGPQSPIGVPGAMLQATTTSSYKPLYSFGRRSGDGEEPRAALIDVNGTLYGTTYAGGSIACAGGCGTVFKITPAGKKTTIYRFGGGTDGTNPSASLLAVGGVLYGTTAYGGTFNVGTIFRVSTKGVESIVYSFGPIPDGEKPVASLIDVNDKLYGTTVGGGNDSTCPGGCGTVFRVSKGGREKILHLFSVYNNDGAYPDSSLLDVSGMLYGTTAGGGALLSAGGGTAYRISTTGTEQVMYAFGYEGSNGSFPGAALINVGGTLYGTTQESGLNGGGTAFSITTSGSLTTLYYFGSKSDGSDPDAPLLNVNGTLYGTTAQGGTYGKGTVFRMSLGGAETVLHSFGYSSDGATPRAGLIDVRGTLYGTTSTGGRYGDGTVFSLKP